MPKKSQSKTKVYFPGLHGLRFFAALMVVFSHVELLKDYHGYPNLYATNLAVYESGRLGVTLFFVLSGYLISYLLLTERRVSGTVSVRNFYIRRVLRIWPLYYLVVFLAFIIIPQIDFFDLPKYSALLPANFTYTFLLYLLLLPQLALSIFEPVPYAEPLWSIGVEEQFYLLWPLLIKYTRNFLLLCVIITVGSMLLKQGAFMLARANRGSANLPYWNYLLSYLYFTRIECMAIGGIGAWFVFRNKKRELKVVYHPISQLLVYGLTAYLLFTQNYKPAFHYAGYAICFCLIIMNISANKKSLIRIENRVFVFLGNISFSMYLFHELAIKIVMQVMRNFGTSFETPAANLLLHTLSIALTILISSLAYYAFEKRFLRLKSRFAVVESGQDLIEKGKSLTPARPVAVS